MPGARPLAAPSGLTLCPGMPRPSSARRALFALAVTVVLLALAELAGRVYVSRLAVPPSAVMDDDQRALWGYLPGCHDELPPPTCIDSRGLRGPEPGPRKAGVRRALFVGDSSVYGVGLPDERTFAQRFAASFGGKVEALNGGVPGYSSTQALVMLRESWLETKPDLLVIGTLWSDNNFDTFVDADLFARRPPTWMRLLVEHSAFARVLAGRGKAAQPIGWGPGGQDTLLAERRVDLATYAANLESMVDLVRERGGEPAFLILANVEDVFRHDRPWPWDPYRAVMRATAERHGAVLVETGPIWRANGGGRALLMDEMHPADQGAELIAQALAQALRERRWAEGNSALRAGNPDATAPLHDPWTSRWAAGLDGPSIAGVVQAGWAHRKRLTVQAYDADSNTVLDQVDLPGQAPFALDARGARAVRLRVTSEAGVARLADDRISLDGGKAWGVVVNLETGNITRR